MGVPISAEFCRFGGVIGPALRPQDGAEEGWRVPRPASCRIRCAGRARPLAAFNGHMTGWGVAVHACAGSRPSRLATWTMRATDEVDQRVPPRGG